MCCIRRDQLGAVCVYSLVELEATYPPNRLTIRSKLKWHIPFHRRPVKEVEGKEISVPLPYSCGLHPDDVFEVTRTARHRKFEVPLATSRTWINVPLCRRSQD
jgi:hypothetical protein